VPTISHTPGCSLKSQHPCLSMHACQKALGLSQAACCRASSAYQGQSVLLRAHERSLSAASVTTAHRVCGKRSWPLLWWPALWTELPGCERRIRVLDLVLRRSAFLRSTSCVPLPGTPGLELEPLFMGNRCRRIQSLTTSVSCTTCGQHWRCLLLKAIIAGHQIHFITLLTERAA
jgi:hypothetical protein